MVDLETYREQARAWLAQNLRRKHGLPALAEPEDRALQSRLAAAGYAGIAFPAEYGGQGLTLEHQRVFYEEAEGYELPVGLRVSLAMIAPTLLDCAAPEFLAVHLPRMFSGDEKWIQLLSESSGGSDLAGVLTRADRESDSWIINGSKVWSTDAANADFGLCLARTDFDLTKHGGLSMFALPLRAPGVTINAIIKSDGRDDEFCEEFFDDVAVADDALIGGLNEGWSVAQRLLFHERNTSGGVGFGVGLHPRDKESVSVGDLVDIVVGRGTPVTSRDEELLTEAYINSLVQDQTSDRVMAGYRTGALTGPWGSLLKLGAGLRDQRRAEIALELAGSAAVVWDGDAANGPIGAMWLNSMVLSVAGGSNEMQRNTISERLLGLPRERAADVGIPFSEALRIRRTPRQ